MEHLSRSAALVSALALCSGSVACSTDDGAAANGAPFGWISACDACADRAPDAELDAQPDIDDATQEPELDVGISDTALEDGGAEACIVSVVAGGDSTCAIRDDGSLWCWGAPIPPVGKAPPGGGPEDAGLAQTHVPELLSAFGNDVRGVSLSTYYYGCVRDSHGEAWCWGMGVRGASGIESMETAYPSDPIRVQGLPPGVTSITAGYYHSCAAMHDGSAWCWGANYHGQLGDGTVPTAFNIKGAVPAQFPGAHVIAIQASSGGAHSCARMMDGSLWCWGSNTQGEIGIGMAGPGVLWPTKVEALGNDVKEFAVGGRASCAIRLDGSVWCWGSNWEGPIGTSAGEGPQLEPKQVSLPAPAARIAMGAQFACAVLESGKTWCWGANDVGQLGIGTSTWPEVELMEPHQVLALPDAAQITAGRSHACILSTSGEVHCWGADTEGQAGVPRDISDPEFWRKAVPVRSMIASCGHVGVLHDPPDAGPSDGGSADADSGDAGPVEPPRCAIDVDTGMYHSCVVLQDGSVWCWGDNQAGQLGLGHTLSHFLSPVRADPLGPHVVDVATGQFGTCTRTPAGQLRCWGYGGLGVEGLDTSPEPLDVDAPGVEFQSLSKRGSSGCGLDQHGAGLCWGLPFVEPSSSSPVLVDGLPSPLRSIVVGESRHGCAVTVTGEAWCFGANEGGQLGIGAYTDSSPPSPVMGLGNTVRAISAGYHYSCAVDDIGHVWCWGTGHGSGQLGDGEFSSSSTTPVRVDALPVAAVTVAAGASGACVIDDDGSVWCWGSNGRGELGIGTLAEPTIGSSELPSQVIGLSAPIQQVAHGWSHVCALDASGAVWCWGWNLTGQVGNGSSADQPSPVRVIEPCES